MISGRRYKEFFRQRSENVQAFPAKHLSFGQCSGEKRHLYMEPHFVPFHSQRFSSTATQQYW